jgi:hypothetical protein
VIRRLWYWLGTSSSEEYRRASLRVFGPLLVVACFVNYFRFRNLNGWLVLSLIFAVYGSVVAWRDM